jgi:hypothetical protein
VLTGTTSKRISRRIHSNKQRPTSLWGHVKAEVSMSALGHSETSVRGAGMVIRNGKVQTYRSKVKVSFKYEGHG